MSDIAIRVEHLGKQYRLGGKQASYSTFRETLVHAANAPLRWLKGERRPEQNEFWALDDVSFEVKHGEALGIIGRNGAGKSTLLKILSRITSPTRGRVDIYGRVGSLLEVGTGFHPELTGRENIFLNGAILGMSRVEIARKFDEIVDFSGVEKFLDTPVKHYSSGMYVRLAFAVAAHLEPEILIVDEVLAVGDAEFQKKCLGKMDDVAHQGRTVLFVSHNMGAISDLCKKGIIIKTGSLLFEGEIKKVIEKYMSEKSYNGNCDLSILPRDKVWEGKHKSINITTRNCSKEIASEFVYGELISIKIRIQSILTEKIYVGIGIRDSFGKQLLHFNSRDQQLGFYAKSGMNELELNFKNILNDGTYYITIWIGDSHFRGQDYLSDCLFFTSNTLLLGNNFSNGSILLDCTWNFEKC